MSGPLRGFSEGGRRSSGAVIEAEQLDAEWPNQHVRAKVGGDVVNRHGGEAAAVGEDFGQNDPWRKYRRRSAT